MFINTGLSHRFKSELFGLKKHLPIIIISMIAGALLILLGWIKFGGPCKVTVFFKIPGGSVTTAAYYILWFIMFTLFGGETAVICNIRKNHGDNPLLLHIAAHLCLFLWYPLFFTTFSQLLSLFVLSAAVILLIIKLKEISKYSIILSTITLIKAIAASVFVYINILFLIIN